MNEFERLNSTDLVPELVSPLIEASWSPDSLPPPPAPPSTFLFPPSWFWSCCCWLVDLVPIEPWPNALLLDPIPVPFVSVSKV